MKAIGKFIIATPIIEKDVKNEVGVFLTEEDKKDARHRKAEIVSVGNEVGDALKQGDVIIYDSYPAFELLLEGKNCVILQVGAVVLVL